MTVSTAEQPTAESGRRQGKRWWRRPWIVPLGAVVLAFLVFSVPPYLGLDPANSRVPQPPGFPGHYVALVLHIGFGTVALVTGLLQVWPWFRARHRKAHRIAGRLYVFAGVLPAGLAGLVVGVTSPFGPVGAYSAVVLVAVWLTTTVMGLRRARQRDFGEHREWMIRSYTLTASTISNRIWAPIMLITLEPQIPTTFDGSEKAFVMAVAGISSWLGWVVPLLAVEAWLIHQRRKVSGRRARPRGRDRARSSTG